MTLNIMKSQTKAKQKTKNKKLQQGKNKQTRCISSHLSREMAAKWAAKLYCVITVISFLFLLVSSGETPYANMADPDIEKATLNGDILIRPLRATDQM